MVLLPYYNFPRVQNVCSTHVTTKEIFLITHFFVQLYIPGHNPKICSFFRMDEIWGLIPPYIFKKLKSLTEGTCKDCHMGQKLTSNKGFLLEETMATKKDQLLSSEVSFRRRNKKSWSLKLPGNGIATWLVWLTHTNCLALRAEKKRKKKSTHANCNDCCFRLGCIWFTARIESEINWNGNKKLTISS